MPNIATVLKEEILRLARKEARRQTGALKKAASAGMPRDTLFLLPGLAPSSSCCCPCKMSFTYPVLSAS